MQINYSALLQKPAGYTNIADQAVKNAQNPSNFNLGKFVTNNLPALGGIGGSIAGTVLEPGGGTIAGGAIGQGFGQFLKDLFSGESVNFGDILKQGAIGGIFGAIPGGEEAQAGTAVAKTTGKDIFNKLLGRGTAGALTGGGSQAIQDFNPSKPNYGENGGNIVKSMAGGSLANIVIPGLADLSSTMAKYAGEKLPNDIRDAISIQKNKILGNMVGANNVQTAIDQGVLPANFDKMNIGDINNYLDKAKSASTNTENRLQSVLDGTSSKSITYGELRDNLNKVFSTADAGDLESMLGKSSFPNAYINGQQATPEFMSYLNKLNDAGTYNTPADKFLQKYLPKVDEKGNPINYSQNPNITFKASQINKIKRNIGENYGKSNLHDQLYKNLKNTVEELSGSSKEVSKLNQTAHQLGQIKQGLNSIIDKTKALPDELTQGMTGNIFKSAHLQTTSNIANGITNLLGYTLGHFPGYIVAKGMEPSIDKELFSPRTADLLSTAYNKLPQGKKAQVLRQVLSQLSIRLGSKL